MTTDDDDRPNIVKRPTEDMTLYTGGFGGGMAWLAIAALLILLLRSLG